MSYFDYAILCVFICAIIFICALAIGQELYCYLAMCGAVVCSILAGVCKMQLVGVDKDLSYTTAIVTDKCTTSAYGGSSTYYLTLEFDDDRQLDFETNSSIYRTVQPNTEVEVEITSVKGDIKMMRIVGKDGYAGWIDF